MKRVVLFLLTVLIIMSSCSRSLTITGNELKTEVFYAGDDVRPFTGVCRIYYPGTATVKEEFHYKKGRMEGRFISYFPDGTVRREGSYSRGMLSGVLREFDNNGNLLLQANFVNDTLEGQFVRKYPDGNIKESGLYSANKRVGDWIEN